MPKISPARPISSVVTGAYNDNYDDDDSGIIIMFITRSLAADKTRSTDFRCHRLGMVNSADRRSTGDVVEEVMDYNTNQTMECNGRQWP